LLVRISDVLAQPCGKSMLVERTRSHFLYRFDSFGGINTQLTSVVGKKKTRTQAVRLLPSAKP